MKLTFSREFDAPREAAWNAMLDPGVGRMAGVGQRMIEGVAKMMADEFFASFAKELHGDAVASTGPVTFLFRAVLRFFRNLFAGGRATA